MRRGFTLIEVLVAVAILSVAAMAILNLGIQSAKLGERLKKKEALTAPLAVAALHGKADFSNTERTLESFLAQSYRIEHEGLRDYLRKRQFFYGESRLSGWDLIPQGEEAMAGIPRFEIIERSVTADGQQGRLYSVRMER